MPSGIYLRTEKHKLINKGRKFPNRKSYSRGITLIHKECAFCKNPFTTDCFMPNKKYCTQSCRSKDHMDVNLNNLKKVNREYQAKVVGSRKGILHPRWINDRNLLKDEHKDRGGSYSRDWGKNIKARDGWKCKLSDTNCKGRMESHHILSWKDYPELRYDINNGITLCHHHHPRTREAEQAMVATFQKILKSL